MSPKYYLKYSEHTKGNFEDAVIENKLKKEQAHVGGVLHCKKSSLCVCFCVFLAKLDSKMTL